MAAVAAFVASCGKGGGIPSFGDNEFPVVAISASNADMKSTYPATIKGVQDVEIRPKASGFITRVCVQEGQKVGVGQLLFVIDNEAAQAQVRQAQAAVNTAQSQVNTAKLTYENSKQLFEKNVVGKFELQATENTYQSAKAQLAQAQAALAGAREALNFCYVKSPAKGVVGNIHSGWRGTLARITVRAVEKMVSHYGSRPENIEAYINPSILRCCFEVEDDVTGLFGARLDVRSYAEKSRVLNGHQKYLLDTAAINRDDLLAAGLRPGHIFLSGVCTMCEKETYHSYRGDGQAAGRNGSLICLRQ